MRPSHLVVLLLALVGGLILGAKKPQLVSMLSGGMIRPAA